MNEALKLLHEINLHITTVHLDMGGNHKYSLTDKAHPVISKIKLYLSDHPNKGNSPDAKGQCKHEWMGLFGHPAAFECKKCKLLRR